MPPPMHLKKLSAVPMTGAALFDFLENYALLRNRKLLYFPGVAGAKKFTEIAAATLG